MQKNMEKTRFRFLILRFSKMHVFGFYIFSSLSSYENIVISSYKLGRFDRSQAKKQIQNTDSSKILKLQINQMKIVDKDEVESLRQKMIPHRPIENVLHRECAASG